MSFFDFLLSPFIYFIEQVYALANGLTNNHGLSIVLLSFAVSLILLPVFILIEKAKKRDDAKKQRMKPLADEIKRCYRGQERYYYLKTLNRQHGYSPLKALLPLLSLLLQIPFFIAAYQFLEGYAPLAGQSFLFIDDLSAPDGLLGRVNVLPIAMTLVNLLTAYFYTRNGRTSELNQMLVVALLFLILLFNLPSGLVLYWTMNNVFSFLRLFITNPEVFKKNVGYANNTLKENIKQIVLKLRIPLVLLAFIGILTQLNWANNHNFNDIGVRVAMAVLSSVIVIATIGIVMLAYKQTKSWFVALKFKPIVFYSLLFFSLYFYFSGKFYFSEVNNQLIALAVLFIIPLQFIGVYSFIAFYRKVKSRLADLLLFTFFILFVGQLLLLISYISSETVSLTFLKLSVIVENSTLLDVASLGLVIGGLSVPFYVEKHRIRMLPFNKNYWWIFPLSVLYVSGLIFLWHPLLVFSSGVDTFDFAGKMILYNNYPKFIIVFLALVFIFTVIPKRLKSVFSFLSLFIVVVVFINIAIVPINLGSLQESRFSDQENLAAPVFLYILEGLIIAVTFIGVHYMFNKKRLKPAIIFLVLLNIIVIGHSSFKAYKSGYLFASKYSSANEQVNYIPFSKEKPNVVFFIADGFQGWYIKQIMDDNPRLVENFEGFTWFPNTVSVSNFTHASMPALLCGHDYGIEWMNSTETLSISEKITKATELFLSQVNQSGYVYTGNKVHYSRLENEKYDNIIPEWNDSWLKLVDEKNLNKFHNIWFNRLYENALFYSVPLAFKPKIYNDSKWLSGFFPFSSDEGCNFSYDKYYSLRLLPHVSRSNSNNANFIFIHSHVPHRPWNIIQNNGKMRCDVSPYENSQWFVLEFSEWLKWMKLNDVYNNTKIVVVSDHGPSWWQYDGDRKTLQDNVIVDTNDVDKIRFENFWLLQPLLLVKDFNANEPFTTDWRLMSNADASTIAFNDRSFSAIDTTGRELRTHYTKWESNMTNQKSMNIHFSFRVKNNVYDLSNWNLIE